MECLKHPTDRLSPSWMAVTALDGHTSPDTAVDPLPEIL